MPPPTPAPWPQNASLSHAATRCGASVSACCSSPRNASPTTSSYGTSFNTSGDTYQYDAGTSQTDPESSRNLELGAKIDSADGRFSTRLAVFESTKYNERNRDSESVDACNYVLSGKRHASGLELDLAGRLTPEWEVFGSYAYIPNAKVDAVQRRGGHRGGGVAARASRRNTAARCGPRTRSRRACAWAAA